MVILVLEVGRDEVLSRPSAIPFLFRKSRTKPLPLRTPKTVLHHKPSHFLSSFKNFTVHPAASFPALQALGNTVNSINNLTKMVFPPNLKRNTSNQVTCYYPFTTVN